MRGKPNSLVVVVVVVVAAAAVFLSFTLLVFFRLANAERDISAQQLWMDASRKWTLMLAMRTTLTTDSFAASPMTL